MKVIAHGNKSKSCVDPDPAETREWVESLESVITHEGTRRALFLLDELEEQLRRRGVRASVQPYSAYRNTIPVDRQGSYPGDLAIEDRITAVMRWNALAMVVRANQAYGELGGHIASYASAAEIFEVGFNHFFRGGGDGAAGDLVFYFNLTRRRASTRARSWRAGSMRDQLANTGRRSAAAACAPTRIPG